MKEIGSEFWTVDLFEKNNELEYFDIGKECRLLMSGRTAIDYVLNDLEDEFKVVYVPNYCCQSMVQPFIDNNYKIRYYDVDVINNNYNIDLSFDCSVFFAMSYFGYSSSNMDFYIEEFSKRNIVVIEDITHRLMCDNNYCKFSHYLIGSLRKWFPVLSGGIAINVNSKFKKNLYNYEINEKFVELKQKAMDLKRDYIVGKNYDKETFLEMFKICNEMMLDYKNKKIDDISLNIMKHLKIDDIKKARIDNCLLIEEKLKNNKNIKLLYEYKKGDCPLFVPIILNKRNEVRNKLIAGGVFLPVHWPNDKLNNEIYKLELSLINDQRYSKNDVANYINKLLEIVGD